MLMAWSHAASLWPVSWYLDCFVFGNRKAKVKTPTPHAAFSGRTDFWDREICMKQFPLKTLRKAVYKVHSSPAKAGLWAVRAAAGRGLRQSKQKLPEGPGPSGFSSLNLQAWSWNTTFFSEKERVASLPLQPCAGPKVFPHPLHLKLTSLKEC